MLNNKVCHISSVHNRYDNRIFQKECVGLASNNFNVTLLISDGKGEEIREQIFIRDLGKIPSLSKRIFFLPFKFFYYALKEKASIYHYHDPELILTGFLLRLTGKNVIYDIHEDYTTAIKDRNYTHPLLAIFFAKIYNLIEKIFTVGTKIIIAEKYYEYKFPKATSVLNYPRINKDVYYQTELNKEINATNENIKNALLYTGNVTLNRGALHHCSILKNNDFVRLNFVGHCSSETFNKISEYLGSDISRLEITGIDNYVPFSRIMQEYNKNQYIAGLAVFPLTNHYYKKELTKIFEYMYAGLPVICSNFPTWKEIIDKTQCGITINPEDEDQYNEAVSFLIKNPKERMRMARNGINAVINKYNWSSEEEKLLNLYAILMD